MRWEILSMGNFRGASFRPDWDAQDIALEGREVTVNQRKLLVRIPRTEFPNCQKVQFEGEVYQVMQITDLSPRFTLLYVKKYGR